MDPRCRSSDIEVADHDNVIAISRSVAPEAADSPLRTPTRTAIDYTLTESVQFGDRELEIRCRATPEFVVRHASPLLWMVLGGGVLFLATLVFYFARLRREIHERRRADKALRESERRYRILVEHAPEVIVVYDVERGRFIDVNENAVRLFKRSREQLLEMSPAELSPRLQPDGRSSASMIKTLVDAFKTVAVKVAIEMLVRSSGSCAEFFGAIQEKSVIDRYFDFIRQFNSDAFTNLYPYLVLGRQLEKWLPFFDVPKPVIQGRL